MSSFELHAVASEVDAKKVKLPNTIDVRVNSRHATEPIVVCCTGPSFNKLDQDLLDEYITIGTNWIRKLYEPTYLITSDTGVARKADVFRDGKQIKFSLHPEIYNQRGTRFSIPGSVMYYSPCRRTDQCIGEKLAEGLFVPNTGLAAVSLAYIMGGNPIFLAGVDLNTPFHAHEPQAPIHHNMINRGKWPTLERELQNWGRVAEFMAARGIEIINLNPDSAITLFPSSVQFHRQK